ncbi:MAG: FAD-binding protein [Planctomycetota bacterium]
MTTCEIINFGRNIRFRPRSCPAPKDEKELLDILQEHREGRIRVMGSKHSWSAAIQTDGVLLDMQHFQKIEVYQVEDQTFARIGAGCQIKTVLEALNRRGLTTPSIGLITEQTISGATATGTHGSGKHSLSHYLHSVRVACFDETGATAKLTDISSGDELQAARCSLGCLGVVTEVTLPCIPQYFVEEQMVRCDTIEHALAMESRTPLQQFFLIPQSWAWYVQRRRAATEVKRSGGAALFRIYWFLVLDVGLHLLIKLFVVWLGSRRITRLLFRRILPAFIFSRWITSDRSDRQLVMEHELFRHLEEEIFVRRSQVVEASRFVADILKLADDASHSLSASTCSLLRSINHLEDVKSVAGCFTHHYPICFRRILSDDTLISMAAGDEHCREDWYSISLITYAEPRDSFYRVARFLAETMIPLFHARLHWGKWCPVSGEQLAPRYPHLPRFREISRRFDPNGCFRNDFVTEMLRFGD